jgi:hypothetical protein
MNETCADLAKKRGETCQSFLTFHAVYYHQTKRELFPPINYAAMDLLRGRVKLLIVLVDDIYDVYKDLMRRGQMFSPLAPSLSDDDEKKKKAMFSSVTNIISLLNWREMEIAVSRSVANYLGALPLVIPVKHPTFIFKKMVEQPLEDLRLLYLSHPITKIREEEAAGDIPAFPGQLAEFTKNVMKDERNVVFYPTAIDELIIEKASNGNYVPNLANRWRPPYAEPDLLAAPLSSEVKGIKPLNPKEYNLVSDADKQAVSSLLSLLVDFIYSKQIISRDYTLVEQSKNGLVVCRPYYKGSRAGGVSGELEYCFALMDEQLQRKCIIISCKDDWNKMAINMIFSTLESEIVSPAPEKLRETREEWLIANTRVLDMTPEQILDKIEGEILGIDYEFSEESIPQGEWTGDTLGKRVQMRKKILEEISKIYEDVYVDKIKAERMKTKDARERVSYRQDIIESDFWNEAIVYANDRLSGRG